jgi:hypothetical protein
MVPSAHAGSSPTRGPAEGHKRGGNNGGSPVDAGSLTPRGSLPTVIDPYEAGMVYVKEAHNKKAMLHPLQQLHVEEAEASCVYGAAFMLPLPACVDEMPHPLQQLHMRRRRASTVERANLHRRGHEDVPCVPEDDQTPCTRAVHMHHKIARAHAHARQSDRSSASQSSCATYLLDRTNAQRGLQASSSPAALSCMSVTDMLGRP